MNRNGSTAVLSIVVIMGSIWGLSEAVLGMAGVGLNTNFSTIKKVGIKPLMLGFLGAAIVAFCSIGLISFFL